MALIDRVKYDGVEGELIWKFPSEDLSTASQVIVNENQEAVFFKEGKALDILGPGRHTLSTGNIPILEKLINLPFGGKTPFTAEIFYVNKVAFTDLKWGTPTPIQVQDPKYNLFVPVRAFGTYGLRIAKSQMFINNIVGNLPNYTTDDVANYLRSVITTRVGDMIAETIIKQNVSIVHVATVVEEVSAIGKAKMAADFNKYGLEITDFFVNSINVPEDDPSVQRLKKALADKAEMDILGDRYAQKRTFDTMEAAASNEGGSGTMGAGLGMGMGYTMGNQMGNQMNQAMNPQAQQANMGYQQNPSPQNDVQSKIAKLESLKNDGLLTQEEFEAKKKQLLQPAEDDITTKIKKLAALKDEGLLTQEEFDAKKKQLLDEM